MAVDSFDPIPGRKQRDRDSYRVSFWYMNQQLWGTGDSSFGQRGVCSHGQSLSHTSRSPRHEMPFSAVLTWALGSKDLLLWISGMQDKEGHSWAVQLPTTTGQGPSWALVLRGWICCILTAPSKQIQMKCPSPIARPELGGTAASAHQLSIGYASWSPTMETGGTSKKFSVSEISLSVEGKKLQPIKFMSDWWKCRKQLKNDK